MEWEPIDVVAEDGPCEDDNRREQQSLGTRDRIVAEGCSRRRRLAVPSSTGVWTVDPVDDRSTKIGPTFCEHVNSIDDSFSVVIGQRRPPLVELSGTSIFRRASPRKFAAVRITEPHLSTRRVGRATREWSPRKKPGCIRIVDHILPGTVRLTASKFSGAR